MKHNIKSLLILTTSMFFGTSLFSQTQIGSRMVESMSIIPSYIATQSISDTIVRNETVNYFTEFDEPMHGKLNIKPTLVIMPSINSTSDHEVTKDKVADFPTHNAPTISKQPMMRFVGEAAFNDWVVYMTLKARLAKDNSDK